MDLPCSECKLVFKDLKTFHIHFTLVHQTCEKYTCKVGSCLTHFKLYPSFKQHVRNQHGIPYRSVEVVAPTEILTTDLNSTEFTSASNVQPSFSNECDMPVQSYKEHNFTDLLVKQEDILVAKLYANPAFPRSLVDQIVKNFSDYLSSPFFLRILERLLSPH